MPLYPAFFEPVLEHFPDPFRILGKRGNRPAGVAGRKDAEFVAELPGTAPAVRGSHDGREVRVLEVLESEEHVGAPGSSSDGGNIAGVGHGFEISQIILGTRFFGIGFVGK
jgi:hypothetical protein